MLLTIPYPIYHDPIIDIIKDNIVSHNSKTNPPRAYIGASSIGDDCELKLWLRYNKVDLRAPIAAKLLMAANDGHRSELLAAEYLRAIPGIELLTHQLDGTQYGFKLLDGKYKGHTDGIITGIPLAPKTPHIWENKCCNEEKFKTLGALINKLNIKEVLKNWNETYYMQAISLMHNMGFTRHYTTVWLAGNRDLLTIRTDCNPELGELLNKKAERIINASNPPVGISTNPSFYKCKPSWCEFAHNCPSLKTGIFSR